MATIKAGHIPGNVPPLEVQTVKHGTQISFLCRLCGEVIIVENGFRILGCYTLHRTCYPIAVDRLKKLVDIIFLPAKDWQKWLDEE